MVSIDVLSSDLEGQAECKLAYQMGGSNLSSWSSIRADCGCLGEACSVVNQLVFLSVADLWSLMLGALEGMGRASILELFVVALE